MSEWREYKLGDIISTNNQSISFDYPFKEIVYLDTGSITKGKIQGFQNYQLSESPSRAKRLVKQNDIIYSTVRPIQRHFGFIDKPKENLVVSTGFTVVETNWIMADPKFIYFYLIADEIVEYLDLIAEGSTSAYPSIRPFDIENLNILLPPLPEQKAIAAVLSSLDDKIDLLHSQNKTLEALAETLFRQWFIEEAQDDWEEKKLSDMAEHIKVNVKPSSNPTSIYYHYSIPAYDDNKMPKQEFGNEILSNKYEVFPNTIMVSKLNPRFPRIWAISDRIKTNSICSTEFQIFKPKQEVYYPFLYFLLKSDEAKVEMEMAASGTSGSHQRVKPSDILNISFTIPSNNKFEKFSDFTNSLLQKIEKNKNQMVLIEKLRDTLLPKLMSGEVRVQM